MGRDTARQHSGSLSHEPEQRHVSYNVSVHKGDSDCTYKLLDPNGSCCQVYRCNTALTAKTWIVCFLVPITISTAHPATY